MFDMLISQCDGVAKLIAAACANAAVPSVLAVAVAFFVTRLKIWNSATRYWAWWLTLAFLVLLPVLLVTFRPPARSPQALVVPLRTVQMQSARSTATLKLETTAPSNPVPAAPAKSFPPIPALLFIVYSGFVLWQFSRVALGLFAGMRLKRRAERLTGASTRFAALIPMLRVRRRVSLATSDQVSAPIAIGYWTPCILLPYKLLGQLDDSEIEQVIAHELAHISRYDDWWIAVQKLIQSIFLFHPLVHFISRRIDLDREMACDDHVISSYQPREYAACLTKIAELVEFGAATALTVPLLARKSHLASRVEMILDRTRAHIPVLSARRLAMFAMFGILTVCLSLRTPALFAFPALSYSYAAWMPKIAVTGVQTVPEPPQTAQPPSPRVVTPPPPAAPSARAIVAPPPPAAPLSPLGTLEKGATTKSDGIDSIAVTSDNGTSTTFEENGNRRTSHSPFPRGTIVFGRNGNSYIIRDRSTLAAAQELLKPQEELSRQQEVLSGQQEKLSEAQEKLSQEQEALSNRGLDHTAASDLEKQLRNLEQKIHAIDLEKSLKTARDAQEQIAELQSMLGDIQSRMGDEQNKTGNEQGKLGEEQSLLGEQQSRLGDQQSKLGEQQEHEARRAEQKLKDLVEQAERKGLAKPLQ